MNKERAYTDAVAADKFVCNQHSFGAGWDAAIAELAKQSEPVAKVVEVFVCANADGKYRATVLSDERLSPHAELYAIPLPQADLVAEVERLKALSVTNIMVAVVPGDGSGHEVYAKSVADIENLLTRLGEKAEDYDAEIGPLRQQLSAAQADNEQLVKALELSNKCLLTALTGGNVKAIDAQKSLKLSDEAIATHKARQGKVQSYDEWESSPDEGGNNYKEES